MRSPSGSWTLREGGVYKQNLGYGISVELQDIGFAGSRMSYDQDQSQFDIRRSTGYCPPSVRGKSMSVDLSGDGLVNTTARSDIKNEGD